MSLILCFYNTRPCIGNISNKTFQKIIVVGKRGLGRKKDICQVILRNFINSKPYSRNSKDTLKTTKNLITLSEIWSGLVRQRMIWSKWYLWIWADMDPLYACSGVIHMLICQSCGSVCHLRLYVPQIKKFLPVLFLPGHLWVSSGHLYALTFLLQ